MKEERNEGGRYEGGNRWRREGRKEGKEKGGKGWRRERMKKGRDEGRKKWMKEEMKEGRDEGRKRWRKEEMKAGKDEGAKEWRREGMKGGRDVGGEDMKEGIAEEKQEWNKIWEGIIFNTTLIDCMSVYTPSQIWSIWVLGKYPPCNISSSILSSLSLSCTDGPSCYSMTLWHVPERMEGEAKVIN